MIGIFLDDLRNLEDVVWVSIPKAKFNWIIVRNFQEFKEAIDRHHANIGFISYDHDLADFHYKQCLDTGGLVFDYDAYEGMELTGKHCAEYAKQIFGDNHPPFVVHSMNPIGKRNIEKLLEKRN